MIWLVSPEITLLFCCCFLSQESDIDFLWLRDVGGESDGGELRVLPTSWTDLEVKWKECV